MRAGMRGLTLTELMIVIVVLGILVAVAYPSYRDFAARAKRNEARSALLQIATNQERFYLNNNAFSDDLTDLGFPVANNFKTETGSYNIALAVPVGAQTYTATATYLLPDPEGGTCGSFTIRENGVKASAPATDCSVRPSTDIAIMIPVKLRAVQTTATPSNTKPPHATAK